MRKFDNLYPEEQDNALQQCMSNAIDNIFDGLVSQDEISEQDMKKHILPEALRLAQKAYYPDLNDIIIYIKDNK